MQSDTGKGEQGLQRELKEHQADRSIKQPNIKCPRRGLLPFTCCKPHENSIYYLSKT